MPGFDIAVAFLAGFAGAALVVFLTRGQKEPVQEVLAELTYMAKDADGHWQDYYYKKVFTKAHNYTSDETEDPPKAMLYNFNGVNSNDNTPAQFLWKTTFLTETAEESPGFVPVVNEGLAISFSGQSLIASHGLVSEEEYKSRDWGTPGNEMTLSVVSQYNLGTAKAEKVTVKIVEDAAGAALRIVKIHGTKI